MLPPPTVEGYTLVPLDIFGAIVNNAGQAVGGRVVDINTYIEEAVMVRSDGTVIKLGTLGGSFSSAHDINDRGDVVGEAETATGETRAYLWQSATGMINLGTLGGNYSWAGHINERGDVIGEAETATGEVHGFLWQSGTGMIDLGALSPVSINERGDIAGQTVTATGDTHAVLWQNGTGMIDLGTLGGANSWAYYINERGDIVGDSETATGEIHAFLWQSGTGMIDLGTLAGGGYSSAYGFNDRGEVTGESSASTVTGDTHAYLWQSGAGMADLGTLGGSMSFARDINGTGQVVGVSTIAGDVAQHAFLWDGTRMLDLNDLLPANSGWELIAAERIKDGGAILGAAVINGYYHQPFVLVPVQ